MPLHTVPVFENIPEEVPEPEETPAPVVHKAKDLSVPAPVIEKSQASVPENKIIRESSAPSYDFSTPIEARDPFKETQAITTKRASTKTTNIRRVSPRICGSL